MATKKWVSYDRLLYFWEKIKTYFTKQSDFDALEERVDGIASTGGEPNIITSIKVNGTAQTIINKAVDISVPTNNNQLTNGAGYQTASDVSTAIGTAIENKADKADSLSEYGITDAYTKTEVDTMVGAKANIASPTFTGTPKAPTATAGTNTTQVATTAFVNTAVTNGISGKADSATTLSGYGITDAYTKSEVDSAIEALDTGVTSVNGNTGAVTITAASIGALTEHQDITGKADKATTLSGYGITNAYTKTEVDTAISNSISSVYKIKGSVDTYETLPSSGLTVGDVYNVIAAYGDYPAGTNWVYTENGWDALGGSIDLSGYVLSSDLVEITNAEIDTIVAS